METKSKIVYWAENNLEADLIVQMLKQYDIPARQLQESFGALNNLSFGAFGEIGIEVPENRAAEAEALLIDTDDPDNAENSENPEKTD